MQRDIVGDDPNLVLGEEDYLFPNIPEQEPESRYVHGAFLSIQLFI